MKACPRCQLEYRDDSRSHCLVDGSPLQEIGDPRIGKLVAGRFVIGPTIGHGGMATVYEGEELATGRRVAVKIMHEALASEPLLRERFRREARNAAAIAHENVVEIVDAGETEEGHPFIVMERLEGETLRAALRRGRLPLGLAIDLGAQLARGLARAHDLGIVHRDLKPENVFLFERSGKISLKLVDFGIARARDERRLTVAGALLGTPAYLAPERVRGKEGDASSDLYSFGILLFEMVTGRLPFESESNEGFLFHHLDTDPPPPSAFVPACPRGLDALVARLLAKNPRDRPLDAHQVVRELTALGAAVPRPSPSMGATTSEHATGESNRVSATTIGLDGWSRRALVLASAAQAAFARDVPPHVEEALATLSAAAARAQALAQTRSVHQARIEEVARSSKEARERLGRAVHALGHDLSESRESVERLRAELARREAEIADLEFQIRVLRGKLDEAETMAERERSEAERALLDAAREAEWLRRAMGEAASRIAEAIRAQPGGERWLADLE